MTRLLAGIFDPSGRADRTRVRRAQALHSATLIERGPLCLAFTGQEASNGEPLCLFDGFLDNGPELADALETSATIGPAELLSLGYRRWGRELVPRLRGDFVLLVWDSERQEGLIARDQLGVRSLYLCETGDGLCFAGEIHQLLALAPRRPAPDPVSVAHWVAISNRPGAATLYEGVRRLNPGSAPAARPPRSAARRRTGRPASSSRWSCPCHSSPGELRAALERAVQTPPRPRRHHRRADERRARLGVGRGVVAAQAPGRVSAYSGVFPEHAGHR